MRVYYQIAHYDQRHRLKWKSALVKSDSFVKQFLQMLFSIMSRVSTNAIDISNTSRTLTTSSAALEQQISVIHPGLDSLTDLYQTSGASGGGASTSFAVASDQCGIVVGTGSTAVAVANFAMGTIIAHGTSAGQFVYYGCWGLNYTTGASSASFDIERIFRNGSGGSIVVAEIGVYGMMADNSANGANGYCILRDVLGATVTVLNGEYLKVKYTITVSN